MVRCYRFAGQGVGNDSWYEYFACGTNASYQAGNGGQLLYLDGVNLGGGGFVYRNGTASISTVPNSTPTPGFQSFGSCSSCQATFYDCVNGNCVNSNVYRTPGLYETLEACESECGASGTTCSLPFQCIDPTNYCPPGKVCIPNSEWSQIEGLAGQLKNKNCN